ncbi:MAG TPA: hypothetical protein VE982_06270 [Gaiellaceae bacterium]|nr:hypothetical protein [Gaiellaceae bacterium]
MVSKHRAGTAAIVAVVLAGSMLVQRNTWNQTSHYALVQSLRDGTPIIDRWHTTTGDVSYVGGHYYSSKAPGLAFAALVPLEIVRGIVRVTGASGRPDSMIWALGVFCAALPALVLLLLVRAVGDALAPGFGVLAAMTLGLGTLVLPFSTLFFAHALSTTLGFAAFFLLWRERQGPPRLALVAAAGVVAGLATVVEYPLVVLGVVLGLYAVSRGDVVRRGLAYGAAAVAGALPSFLYNAWAFGSPLTFPYAHAVLVPGKSGHDVIGANDQGVYGVASPHLGRAVDLLFSQFGLLRLTPVVAMGAVGAVLLYRGGRRAEALVVAGVAALFLLYNSGYYLPFGGWTPGPRFLIPVLPFLAFPLALSYRRFAAVTTALAVPSAAIMIAATATEPLVPTVLGPTEWEWRLRNGVFATRSWLSLAAGRPGGWLAPLPFLVLIAVALGLLLLALPRLAIARRDVPLALAAFAAWVVIFFAGPKLNHGLSQDVAALALAAALAAAVVALHQRTARSFG